MAIKYDEGKPDFTLIPQLALKEVAKVATKGGIKYPSFNYSKEKSPRRYVAAGLRHINEYLLGENIDEIGTHHLANAAMSIMMALDNILNGTVEDDRNKNYNVIEQTDLSVYIVGVFQLDNYDYDEYLLELDRSYKLNNFYNNFYIISQQDNTIKIRKNNNYIPKVGDKLQ